MDIDADDVGYVCMPLFHSNAVMVGWAPSHRGRGLGGPGPEVQREPVAARRPPVRRHLVQLHGQAPDATWWPRPSGPTTPTTRCGWRSATRARPTSSTSSPDGSACGSSTPSGPPRAGWRSTGRTACPPRRLGRAGEAVQVVDEDGRAKPVARFDADGRLLNAEECVGRDRQHRRRGGRSRATTTTTRPTSARPGTAGTGAVTSATSTRTATSTSPAATRTGSGSTARTSPPARSRPRWSGTPTWWWRRSTASPTSRPGTR